MTTGIITGTVTGTAMTMTDPLHVFAQWFSPAFPLGAFAWSHGLEWAIEAGEVGDGEALAAWLEDLLRHGSGRADAVLLSLALRAPGAGALAELDELACALAFGAARRAETREQGAAFVRMVNALYGWQMAPMALPVAVGAAAARLGLPGEATLRHALHAFAANLVSAAVRLVPLGQSDGQRVLAGLFPVIDHVARHALTADEDDLATSALRADLAALRQETMTTRIFRS